MSAVGERAWTCDLISKQACPCQPESHRRCASRAPKPASLCPGAGEPPGLPVPIHRHLCVSASCLPPARHRCCATDVANSLSLHAWLHGCFGMGESRSWTPCLLGATHASQAGDGWGCSSSLLCPLPSLLKAGLCISGSPGHVP